MDPIHRAAFDAVIAAAAKRGCSLKSAEDLVPADIKLRSWAEWARKPGIVNGQPNGLGSMRRQLDLPSWRKAVADYAASKQPKAAA